MKKVILLVLAIVFTMGTQINAQDAKSTYKKAKKALSSYHLDAAANFEKLVESVEAFNSIPADSEIAQSSTFYNTKGEAFNDMSNAEYDNRTKSSIINQKYETRFPDAASQAYMAYAKALEFAEKKYHKKDAVKGLGDALRNTIEEGRFFYSVNKFDEAYNSFNNTFKVHELLKANGGDSPLTVKADYNQQLFVKILCAEKANRMADVEGDLDNLYTQKFENAKIYSTYFNYLTPTDETKAMEVLNVGRELYPDDQGLMYAEINYFLKQNKTDVLVDKLKVAIEKDPKNASLYSTLGNVYDKMSQNQAAAKDDAASKASFDNAKVNYEKAIEVNPSSFDATYSLGALYYNKAASMTGELNKLGDDYSKAGMKKYDAFKVNVDKAFADALPYFKAAEKINDKDINTLIALQEISVRNNDIEAGNAYKARIEALRK